MKWPSAAAWSVAGVPDPGDKRRLFSRSYDMDLSSDICEVFVSHSASDRDLAEAVVAAIRSALVISGAKPTL